MLAGLTLPLSLLLGIEGFLAISLLAPITFARPAVSLCKATAQSVGKTICLTIAAFLLLMVASCVSDINALRKYSDGASVGREFDRRCASCFKRVPAGHLLSSFKWLTCWYTSLQLWGIGGNSSPAPLYGVGVSAARCHNPQARVHNIRTRTAASQPISGFEAGTKRSHARPFLRL
jgi:hypothetical protein